MRRARPASPCWPRTGRGVGAGCASRWGRAARGSGRARANSQELGDRITGFWSRAHRAHYPACRDRGDAAAMAARLHFMPELPADRLELRGDGDWRLRHAGWCTPAPWWRKLGFGIAIGGSPLGGTLRRQSTSKRLGSAGRLRGGPCYQGFGECERSRRRCFGDLAAHPGAARPDSGGPFVVKERRRMPFVGGAIAAGARGLWPFAAMPCAGPMARWFWAARWPSRWRFFEGERCGSAKNAAAASRDARLSRRSPSWAETKPSCTPPTTMPKLLSWLVALLLAFAPAPMEGPRCGLLAAPALATRTARGRQLRPPRGDSPRPHTCTRAM